MVVKNILLALIGFCGGATIASAIFAILLSIKIVNRMAYVSKTTAYIRWYEECTMWGLILANVVIIFGVELYVPEMVGIFVSFFIGIFSGTFLVSLAETIKILPMGLYRGNVKKGLGIIVFIMAAAKLIGSMLALIWF